MTSCSTTWRPLCMSEKVGIPGGVADLDLDKDSHRWSPRVFILGSRVIHRDGGALDDHCRRFADHLKTGVSEAPPGLIAEFFDDDIEARLVGLEVKARIHRQVADAGAVGRRRGHALP
jgi:hypothetical protein